MTSIPSWDFYIRENRPVWDLTFTCGYQHSKPDISPRLYFVPATTTSNASKLLLAMLCLNLPSKIPVCSEPADVSKLAPSVSGCLVTWVRTQDSVLKTLNRIVYTADDCYPNKSNNKMQSADYCTQNAAKWVIFGCNFSKHVPMHSLDM